MTGCRTLSLALLLALCGSLRAADQNSRKFEELGQLSDSLEALSERVNGAVVKILTTGYDINEETESGTTELITRQKTTGSGVLLTSDGYIATNVHVIRRARRIRVEITLPERKGPRQAGTKRAMTMLDAKIVGADSATDLAILKVDGANYPFLELGDSRALRQGQLVMAFGSPLGLQNSVSLGVVSSVARQITPDSPMIYIQTDASINPGNSGGPLVDMSGRVVGINTMIMSESGGSEGIGFAVPSNILRTVFEQIRKEGRVHRGQIGASVQTITPLLAAGLSLPQDWGVLVADITPQGPADKAGLEIGDIVLGLDGIAVDSARQFEVNLYRYAVGSKVKLEVLRGSDRLTMNVPVAANEESIERFADLVNPDKNLIPKLGILGIPIDKRLAGALGDLRKPYGIVVAARAEGADADIDLEAGDVIYAINNQPTATIAALEEVLARLKPGDPVVLQVEHDNRLEFMSFEME